jgi:hypothetical protein
VLEDVARLVADLRANRERVVTAGLGPRVEFVDHWEAAFLSGYGDGAGPFAPFRAMGMLRRWAELEARYGRFPWSLVLVPARRLMSREALNL